MLNFTSLKVNLNPETNIPPDCGGGGDVGFQSCSAHKQLSSSCNENVLSPIYDKKYSKVIDYVRESPIIQGAVCCIFNYFNVLK